MNTSFLRPPRPGRPPVKGPDPLKQAVAVVLHAARVRRGLSETQLAAASRVSLSEISELEHGHYSPTLHTLERLARALGLRASTLLRRAEDRLRRRRRTRRRG